MKRLLQLVGVVVLLGGCASAQLLGPAGIPQKDDKAKKNKGRDNVEWLWQYSPPPEDGRENDLIQDPKFVPFLEKYLTAPQAFWGPQGAPRKSLSATAFDFLSVPGRVIADSDRYVTITGCVFHFCSDRGLLWVDLNAKQPLVIFAAIDWTTENKTPDDPGASYTLWVFTNDTMSAAGDAPNRIPPAFLKSIARWTGQPVAGQKHLQNITTAVLVDPDGTPHTLAPSALGVTVVPTKDKP